MPSSEHGWSRIAPPLNIFVTPRGQVKVLDFGLAKLVAARHPQSDPSALTHLPGEAGDAFFTSPGTTVGTVAYMSPEQARGEDLDARTDLFSFGVVLYEMATATLPFSGTTSAVIFEAILNRAPVSPVALNSHLPAELERIINNALEKDRDVRYQHATDMRADLLRLERHLESGRTAVAAPTLGTGAAAPRRNRRAAMAAAAVVAVAALSAIYVTSRSSRTRAPALDAIAQATDAGRTDEVFRLMQEARVDLNDARLAAIDQRIGGTLAVDSSPQSAAASGERTVRGDFAQLWLSVHVVSAFSAVSPVERRFVAFERFVCS